MPKMRWGSSRRSPRLLSRLGKATPLPNPHLSRRLWRLDSRAFGAQLLWRSNVKSWLRPWAYIRRCAAGWKWYSNIYFTYPSPNCFTGLRIIWPRFSTASPSKISNFEGRNLIRSLGAPLWPMPSSYCIVRFTHLRVWGYKISYFKEVEKLVESSVTQSIVAGLCWNSVLQFIRRWKSRGG